METSYFEILSPRALLHIFAQLPSAEVLLLFLDFNPSITRLLIENYLTNRCIDLTQLEHVSYRVFRNFFSKLLYSNVPISALKLNEEQVSLLLNEMIANDDDLQRIFPYLKHLTLTADSSNELNPWSNIFTYQLSSLSLVYHSSSATNQFIVDTILRSASLQTCIIQSIDRSQGLKFSSSYSFCCNIRDLTINLAGLTDLRLLIQHLPRVERLCAHVHRVTCPTKNVSISSNLIQFELDIGTLESDTWPIVEYLLQQLIKLQHLRLNIRSCLHRCIIDGRWMQERLLTRMPELEQFDFCFAYESSELLCNVKPDTVIATFESKFWREQWPSMIVGYHIGKDVCLLFTVPFLPGTLEYASTELFDDVIFNRWDDSIVFSDVWSRVRKITLTEHHLSSKLSLKQIQTYLQHLTTLDLCSSNDFEHLFNNDSKKIQLPSVIHVRLSSQTTNPQLFQTIPNLRTLEIDLSTLARQTFIVNCYELHLRIDTDQLLTSNLLPRQLQKLTIDFSGRITSICNFLETILSDLHVLRRLNLNNIICRENEARLIIYLNDIFVEYCGDYSETFYLNYQHNSSLSPQQQQQRLMTIKFWR